HPLFDNEAREALLAAIAPVSGHRDLAPLQQRLMDAPDLTVRTAAASDDRAAVADAVEQAVAANDAVVAAIVAGNPACTLELARRIAPLLAGPALATLAARFDYDPVLAAASVRSSPVQEVTAVATVDGRRLLAAALE